MVEGCWTLLYIRISVREVRFFYTSVVYKFVTYALCLQEQFVAPMVLCYLTCLVFCEVANL